MTLAKRTGRVTGYDDWLQPRLVENALELLDEELRRYADQIDSVHLCFTTDPFMYDSSRLLPIQAVSDMSVEIIRRLNREGIPVTTLTKGVYPDGLIQSIPDLHPDNQYGVSLVSLSESYRAEWEPGAASAEGRIASLQRLALQGAHTWVSAEPYPTPNIDDTASHVVSVLQAVAFAEKIVFGKWNYNRLVTEYEREHAFYAGVAQQVVDWCSENGTALHIKTGTPLSTSTGDQFLRPTRATGSPTAPACASLAG
jgi:DNA repair photolyase